MKINHTLTIALISLSLGLTACGGSNRGVKPPSVNSETGTPQTTPRSTTPENTNQNTPTRSDLDGGSDYGGGDILSKKAKIDQTIRVINSAWKNIPYLLNLLQISYLDYDIKNIDRAYNFDNQEHFKRLNLKFSDSGVSIREAKIYSQLVFKIFSNNRIIKEYQQSTLVIRDQGSCQSKHKAFKDGSSHRTQILCLSAKNISESVTQYFTFPTVLGLIMHELAEKSGLNEEEASLIQKFITLDNSSNGQFYNGDIFISDLLILPNKIYNLKQNLKDYSNKIFTAKHDKSLPNKDVDLSGLYSTQLNEFKNDLNNSLDTVFQKLELKNFTTLTASRVANLLFENQKIEEYISLLRTENNLPGVELHILTSKFEEENICNALKEYNLNHPDEVFGSRSLTSVINNNCKYNFGITLKSPKYPNNKIEIVTGLMTSLSKVSNIISEIDKKNNFKLFQPEEVN